MQIASRKRTALFSAISAFLPATSAAVAGCVAPMATYATRVATFDSLARSAIAAEDTLHANTHSLNTLGVAPLGVLSADTAYASLGYGVAALLMTDLGRINRLTIVERLRFDALLREQQFGRSGSVDPSTAPRIGQLVGAGQLVIGTIDLTSQSAVRIDSRIANSMTGQIGAPLTGIALGTEVFDAEKALAFKLFDQLGITLTAAERRAIERRPTQSLAAFLAYSRGLQAEATRDITAAKSNYAAAARLDPKFSAPGERIAAIDGTPEPASTTGVALAHVLGISNDLVNRPAPVTIGTGADAPVASKQSVTIGIVIRTP